MAASAQDAQAAKFGTKYAYQHLQDLTARGPNGEALALGYETATHYFFLPYNLTGRYVLLVRGSGRDLFAGRDVYHELPQATIERIQGAGWSPIPLPPSRIAIFDYPMAYVLGWCIPATFVLIWLFSMLGIGSDTRGETRRA